MLKKFISVLICSALMLSAVPVISLAVQSEDSLNIAVASDLHYCLPEASLTSLTDDTIFGYANRRAAMENESGFIIDAFLNQCANDSTEYVLISGDLVDNGRNEPQQHAVVAKKLADFEKATGKQVYVIDGNHDLGENSQTEIDDFKRIYADFGYNTALTVDSDSCSYTANLGQKYRLIALDSCDHTVSTADGLTAKRVNWLTEQAKKAKQDGKYIILMMHHNLLDHMPMQRIISKNFIVRNHTLNAELFANMGIRVVFTGHEHCSDVSQYISTLGNKIYDFATTSLTMYPLAYRLVSFADDKITYSSKTINKIDTSALSSQVSGYTDEQLSLMNEDINSYALGFLKAGITYRLSLSLSMQKIGIAEGEPFYKLVSTAVGGLSDIMNMPYYGENSVASLAKEYNINIPDSEYKNGWDLATTIVAAHYAGSEAYDMNSNEITLLLRTAALILRSDLAGINDDVFLNAANKVLANYSINGVSAELTKLCTKVFGAVKPGEYFVLALISPLIYDFICDSDAANDNNGEIMGYCNNVSSEKSDNIIEKLKAFFTDLIKNMSLFFECILKPITA